MTFLQIGQIHKFYAEIARFRMLRDSNNQQGNNQYLYADTNGEIEWKTAPSSGSGSDTTIYRTLSHLVSGNDYVIGEIEQGAAEGNALYVIRAIEPTIKQIIMFTISHLPNNGLQITVLNNIYEGDTPRFDQLRTMLSGGITEICLRCVGPVIKAELRIYNNQDDSGDLPGYGSFINCPSPISIATGTVISEHSLSNRTLSTTGEIKSDTQISAPNARTSQLKVDQISNNVFSEVYMGSNLGMGGNNIEYAKAVNTKEILNNQGGPLKLKSELDTEAQNILSSHPSGVNFDSNINMNNKGLVACSSINISNPATGNLEITNGNIDMHSRDILDGGVNEFITGKFTSLEVNPGPNNAAKISLGATTTLTDVKYPVATTDVATKIYVDNHVSSNLSGYLKNPMESDLLGGLGPAYNGPNGYNIKELNSLSTLEVYAQSIHPLQLSPNVTTIGFNDSTLSDVLDPVDTQDAATKNYVDSSISNIQFPITNPMSQNLGGGGFIINNVFHQAKPHTQIGSATVSVQGGTISQMMNLTGGKYEGPQVNGNNIYLDFISQGAINIPFNGVYSIHVYGQWNGNISGSAQDNHAVIILIDKNSTRLHADPSAHQYQSGYEWLHTFNFTGYLDTGKYSLFANQFNTNTRSFDGVIRVTQIT